MPRPGRSVAIHHYRLSADSQERSLPYAHITEIYDPDYIPAAELAELSGSVDAALADTAASAIARLEAVELTRSGNDAPCD